MSSSNTSPDTYSNDSLSNNASTDLQSSSKRRRSPPPQDNRISPTAESTSTGAGATPAAKRIACVICRKRKLKCDGNKPSCSTCKRLNHDCAYDEIRRKSGPKRGYVKALEERLKQVEEMLKTQEPASKTPDMSRPSFPLSNAAHSHNTGLLGTPNADFGVTNPDIGVVNDRDHERWHFPGDSPQPAMEDMTFDPNLNMTMTMDPTFTWEMIGLGLDEPLPPQETIDELHQIYFEKIHPSLPMIHKYRYLAAMNLAPNQRPPVCLRYAMWAAACSVTEKYLNLKDHFYQRARKYVEQDYLKGHGEHMISVGHAQTHILLSSYEFKMMYFPRAWMSTGSAVRLCQMMGLHRLDGAGLDVKQCLSPPRDWTEREERRRTFWMAFCEDRYASIGTGWPMTFDENDILTNLPASEEAFEKSRPEQTQTLHEAFNPSGAAGLSAFAAVSLMAAFFGRNLVHLHRPDADDCDGDLSGEFWKRHRNMDNILLNTSLSLPSHLKLPTGINSPNTVFMNMNVHTSTICLHQAAIYKADKNRLPASVSKESKLRCISSANEIASIMRMISHMDLSAMNPFISFCLYVAARVFIQYLKSRPDDDQTGDALRFLLSAMNAMKMKNPLTESFLVQLDVDLESLGLRDPKYKAFVHGYSGNSQSQAFSQNQQGGPDGRIDQCNFLKIVDESIPLVEESPTSGVGANSAGPATTTAQSADPFQSYTGTLDWLPESGIPSRPSGQQQMRNMAGLVVLPNSQQTAYGIQRQMTFGQPDVEMDLSSADAGPSDRPTPSSTAPSDGRANLGPCTSGSGHSACSSFETSPVASHKQSISEVHVHNQQVSATFYATSDVVTEYIPALGHGHTGMTPGASYSMPQTPGRGEYAGAGGWDMSQGLTPIGEGVFRELMGIAPMDMGWENPS